MLETERIQDREGNLVRTREGKARAGTSWNGPFTCKEVDAQDDVLLLYLKKSWSRPYQFLLWIYAKLTVTERKQRHQTSRQGDSRERRASQPLMS